MAKIKAKKLFRGLNVARGGGLVQMLLGGLVGAIGWGIGSDLYHRITRGRRSVEAGAEDRDED
jgi:hypothetical protein